MSFFAWGELAARWLWGNWDAKGEKATEPAEDGLLTLPERQRPLLSRAPWSRLHPSPALVPLPPPPNTSSPPGACKQGLRASLCKSPSVFSPLYEARVQFPGQNSTLSSSAKAIERERKKEKTVPYSAGLNRRLSPSQSLFILPALETEARFKASPGRRVFWNRFLLSAFLDT